MPLIKSAYDSQYIFERAIARVLSKATDVENLRQISNFSTLSVKFREERVGEISE